MHQCCASPPVLRKYDLLSFLVFFFLIMFLPLHDFYIVFISFNFQSTGLRFGEVVALFFSFFFLLDVYLPLLILFGSQKCRVAYKPIIVTKLVNAPRQRGFEMGARARARMLLEGA